MQKAFGGPVWQRGDCAAGKQRTAVGHFCAGSDDPLSDTDAKARFGKPDPSGNIQRRAVYDA